MSSRNKSVRLPKETWDSMEGIAKELDLSVNRIMQALADSLVDGALSIEEDNEEITVTRTSYRVTVTQ